MEDINLHFTGDFHAIGAANNLLAAMLDNHIHHGNALGIDPRRITWKRCVDMNDRQLRSIVDGLGGRATISRWQEVMGTPVDGVISGQVIPDGRTYGRPNLLCVTYGGQGSTLIRAVQRVVGAVPDGLYGPDSIRRTQIRLGVDSDCWFGPATARALQERLNQGRF